ncbi:hypothetical protein Bca4012_063851 [Brassica carinata]
MKHDPSTQTLKVCMSNPVKDLFNPRLHLFVSYMSEEVLKKLPLKTKRRTGVRRSQNINSSDPILVATIGSA